MFNQTYSVQVSILDTLDPVVVSRLAKTVCEELDGMAAVEVGSFQITIVQVFQNLGRVAVLASVEEKLDTEAVGGGGQGSKMGHRPDFCVKTTQSS